MLLSFQQLTCSADTTLQKATSTLKYRKWGLQPLQGVVRQEIPGPRWSSCRLLLTLEIKIQLEQSPAWERQGDHIFLIPVVKGTSQATNHQKDPQQSAPIICPAGLQGLKQTNKKSSISHQCLIWD